MSKPKKGDTRGKISITAVRKGRTEQYTYTDKRKAQATINRLKKQGFTIQEASGF
ncbi:hypothetical protein IJM86_04645 [bacterium]|nr:hypothetical protein [bacterium]